MLTVEPIAAGVVEVVAEAGNVVARWVGPDNLGPFTDQTWISDGYWSVAIRAGDGNFLAITTERMPPCC